MGVTGSSYESNLLYDAPIINGGCHIIVSRTYPTVIFTRPIWTKPSLLKSPDRGLNSHGIGNLSNPTNQLLRTEIRPVAQPKTRSFQQHQQHEQFARFRDRLKGLEESKRAIQNEKIYKKTDTAQNEKRRSKEVVPPSCPTMIVSLKSQRRKEQQCKTSTELATTQYATPV